MSCVENRTKEWRRRWKEQIDGMKEGRLLKQEDARKQEEEEMLEDLGEDRSSFYAKSEQTFFVYVVMFRKKNLSAFFVVLTSKVPSKMLIPLLQL